MLPAAESTKPLEVRILRQVKPLKLKPGRGFKISVIFFFSAQKAGPKENPLGESVHSGGGGGSYCLETWTGLGPGSVGLLGKRENLSLWSQHPKPSGSVCL